MFKGLANKTDLDDDDSFYLPCGISKDYEKCPALYKLERIIKQTDNPEKILKLWKIPKKYINVSFANFQGAESVKEVCQEIIKKQEDILLTGQTGCGKTHLAVAILREFIITGIYPFNDDTLNDKPDALFITVPELLLEIRESFSDKKSSESSIVKKYSQVPLLLLDDLGAEKTTEWAESTLYLIIDRRNRDMKWTIVTTNLSLKDIENTMGARIASRLSDMKVINIKLPDYRKKR